MMIPLFENKPSCFGCSACREVCPVGAIRMEPDGEGFLYPVADPEQCVGCGRCADICPGKKPVTGYDGQAYAVRCKDTQLLKDSTSGGAFSLLAEPVLEEGGLVCGAVFTEDFRVRHVLSREIGPMRKSKYIQSDLQDSYGQIRQALAQGKQVLFTGTPCQCDAVRSLFGEQTEGLILAALVCRGVQSPGLWKDYVNFLSRDGKLQQYCFRDKQTRNDGHTVSYTVDGNRSTVSMEKDAFSRLYMKTITLRPSCYRCPYTRWDLPFDLTIGDFWGIEKAHPQLADGMGTSLVIVRTPKGRQLLEKVGDRGLILECSRDAALQPSLKEPPKETVLRKLLFRDFSGKDASGSSNIPLILKKYGG